MNGLSCEEPYDEIHAVLYGVGIGAQLILKTPNTKNLYNLEKCHFYNEFKVFECEAINDIIFGKLYYLQDKIKDYCLSYGFVTYESQPALELVIYDYRDELR